MKKVRIKLPPRNAAIRAAGRLTTLDVKAVCFWCGHRYDRWSYKAQDTPCPSAPPIRPPRRKANLSFAVPSIHMDGKDVLSGLGECVEN